MKTYIFPFQSNSHGARMLSESLGISRIRRENSKFIGSGDKQVINWGNSEVPDEISKCRIVNEPKKVYIAVNKLRSFKLFSKMGVRVPDWTEDLEEALNWKRKDKALIFARAKLSGHSGEGIIMSDDEEHFQQFAKAPLFTKYIPKEQEYRIHYAFGKKIDEQRKVLRKTDDEGNPIDPKSVDFRVRSWHNGFIFQREGINPPRDVYTEAEKAYKASSLDFGAVDVIFNAKQGKAYVLEINTSPGLEGTTIENYCTAFKRGLSL